MQINFIHVAYEMGSLKVEKRWIFPLVFSLLLFVFLLAASFNMGLVSTLRRFLIFPSQINQSDPNFVEEKLRVTFTPPPPAASPIPRFAYLISGSKGDLEKLWRTLQALYHPWNYYVVHLDLESPEEERMELASRVDTNLMFNKVGNVFMIKKANMVTYRGPTMVANTLHACAILLKRHKDWDWFINLSASDYPLVTQDDLLYVFSGVKRELNFIEHYSNLGWKLTERAMPLIVDPGLYQNTKSEIFSVDPKRSLPSTFKLFAGSAWMILSRAYVEYLIWGWDNLPRIVLMYYANFVSSPEGYFHTVVCNAPEFSKTVVNNDMHYISWDDPPQQHPHFLSLNKTAKMIASGAAFARKFKVNDPVLDKIDNELLGRRNGSFTPGGWCSGKPRCSKVKDPTKLKPGLGAKRLQGLIDKLLLLPQFTEQQCT